MSTAAPVYINITSEGALFGEELLDEDQAFQTFFSFRSNQTVIQARVIGIENLKYTIVENGERQTKESKSLVIAYGPYRGHIPVSEVGLRESRHIRLIGQFVAAVPIHFSPTEENEGRGCFIFSRIKAIEVMRKANLEKIQKDAQWTGVVKRITRSGYLLDVGGYPAWLPLSAVDWDRSEQTSLSIGDNCNVVITERNDLRIRVSRKASIENPFDKKKMNYSRGGHYIAKVTNIYDRNVFAQMVDGVDVVIQLGGGRNVLKVGHQVIVKVVAHEEKQKRIIGLLDRVL